MGDAVGRALAVIMSAVEDLPNVTGRDDVCRESLGRLFSAGWGITASMLSLDCSSALPVEARLLVGSEADEDRDAGSSFGGFWGAMGFIARAIMLDNRSCIN